MGAGNTEQMSTMKNVFRGMCVLMVPMTYHFPTVSNFVLYINLTIIFFWAAKV